MNKLFIEIYEQVWKEIFPNQMPYDIQKFKKLFTNDIPLPIECPCKNTEESVYSSPEYGYKQFISQDQIIKRTEENNFVEPLKRMTSLADVLGQSKNIFLFKGSRSINSDVLEKSDDIYSSSFIYNSTHVYSSNKVLYSNNCTESEYLIASKGSKASSFGIRIIDSSSTSNCFDVSFIAKSSNCYFCHDGYDLRDCMFCFHLVSKQYCIANVQYEKEEYFKLKEIILNDYFKQLEDDNSFVTLSNL